MYSQTFETTSSEIHLRHITKTYQTGWNRKHIALDNASLWIRRGETVSVVGPTGCGKSTLLPFPEHYRARVADGEPVTIGLRPEHLRLTSAGEAPGLPCTVEMVELSVSDAAHILHLRHRDHPFCAKVELQQPVRPRETVWLHFPPQHLYYFDRDDKRL